MNLFINEKLIALKKGQVYTCDRGCGECNAIEFDFECSREENLETGKVISKTFKAFKSSCCGDNIEIWDEALQMNISAIKD